ncbi:MAG: chloride channel protein [Deltaproteobacteria bacterium]|nr:chloride channel protein [Deltaproteobacteria bacterium]
MARFGRDFNFQAAGKWLILGVTVGIVAGLGAMAFQIGLQWLKGYLLIQTAGLGMQTPGGETSDFVFPAGDFVPWLVVLLPALGGLVSGLLVYRLAPEAEGHGTDAAINAYHRKLGRIRGRVPIIKMVASIITLGSGGSGGREGPIAQIGAGFGSFLATRLKLSVRSRRWLLAAGIGAGIGSIFRAPLAGALFAAEVLYSSEEVEAEVILPATVASIVAYSVYASRFGWSHIFTNAGNYGFDNPLELLPYLILAIVVAFAALLYVRTFYGVNTLFKKLKIPNELKPMIGGALTGAIALVLIKTTGNMTDMVDVLGSGYGIIQNIITKDGMGIGIGILLLVSVGKIATTSLTIGSGGSGGVFGPSMVIGATLGTAVGVMFHHFFPGVVPHPTTFAIVGMAGFFAAAANTPISTVIMVSELTGNYELLMPTMWVCTLAFLLGKRWSIYHEQVRSKTASPAHFGELASEILSGAHVRDVMHKGRKFVTLKRMMNLKDILDITAHSRQRIFPVLDRTGNLVGGFGVTDLNHALHHERANRKFTTAGEMMQSNCFTIPLSASAKRAQRLMRNNHVEELLVVEDDNPKHVVGIITAADVVLAYTRKLSEARLSEEEDGDGHAVA